MTRMGERSAVQEWIDRAVEDEASAAGILSHKEGAPSTVCFLSQQLAEKSLKALLLYHDIPPPKVHDLLQLETLASSLVDAIQQHHAPLLFLNRYYIESRYPGDFPEFSWKEAEEALCAARVIQRFCVDNIFEATQKTSPAHSRASWWQRVIQGFSK